VKLIILPILSCFFLNSWGQINFECDTTAKENDFRYNQVDSRYNYVDSLFKLQKENDFELYVITDLVKSLSWHFFILTFKSGKWSGRFFIKESYPNLPLREISGMQSKIDCLWSKLNSENILTLKSQEQLRSNEGEEPKLAILDGVGYTFVLVANGCKRSFHYSNPKLYSQEFKHISEFKWVIKIIEWINTAFNLSRNMIG
jgi:hypothetical protein